MIAADDPDHPFNVRRRKWVEKANIPDRDFTWDRVPPPIRSWCQDFIATASKGQPGAGLLFSGPPGRGKTAAASLTLRDTLMASNDRAMGRAPSQVPRRPGYFISYSEFMRTYYKSWRDDEQAATLIDDLFFSSSKTWERAKVLVLDDVGKEHAGASEFSVHVLHDLLRSRWDKGALTILTTNLTPEEFGNLYGEAMGSFIYEGFTFLQMSDRAPDNRKKDRGRHN